MNLFSYRMRVTLRITSWRKKLFINETLDAIVNDVEQISIKPTTTSRLLAASETS